MGTSAVEAARVAANKGAMQAPLVIDGKGNATERLERDANGGIWHCVDGIAPVAVTPTEARTLVYASALNANADPEGKTSA